MRSVSNFLLPCGRDYQQQIVSVGDSQLIVQAMRVLELLDSSAESERWFSTQRADHCHFLVEDSYNNPAAKLKIKSIKANNATNWWILNIQATQQ